MASRTLKRSDHGTDGLRKLAALIDALNIVPAGTQLPVTVRITTAAQAVALIDALDGATVVHNGWLAQITGTLGIVRLNVSAGPTSEAGKQIRREVEAHVAAKAYA